MAVFFLFWAFYFYDQNKFKPFLIFIFLSLLIREDVSFAIFMFGIIAILDKRKIKWILTPILLSSIYFFIALKIIAHFSASGNYKFMIYYSWLGATPLEIIENFFPKIVLVLQHILTLANLELILGLFLFFLFIPVHRPKYALLCLGQFIQIALGLASGEVILRTHYATVFLTAFAIATVFSLKALHKNQKIQNFYLKNKDVLVVIICTAMLYNFLAFGPLITFIKTVITIDYDQVKLKADFVSQIPKDASLITGYDFITNLSSRKNLYALNYAFLGKQQYNAGNYIIPDSTEYLLMNFNDFVGFNLQYENSAVSKYYYQGADNLLKLITEKNLHLKKVDKNIALWDKEAPLKEPLLYQEYLGKAPDIKNRQEKILTDQLKFLGYEKNTEMLSLYFQATELIEQNYLIRIDDKIYPLGFGFFPTSNWQKDSIVRLNFYNLKNPQIAQILNITGGYEVDGIGSIKDAIDKEDVLEEFPLT
jgi:uncharacterized membrane protein